MATNTFSTALDSLTLSQPLTLILTNPSLLRVERLTFTWHRGRNTTFIVNTFPGSDLAGLTSVHPPFTPCLSWIRPQLRKQHSPVINLHFLREILSGNRHLDLHPV